jgi:hypothetical protein
MQDTFWSQSATFPGGATAEMGGRLPDCDRGIIKVFRAEERRKVLVSGKRPERLLQRSDSGPQPLQVGN